MYRFIKTLTSILMLGAISFFPAQAHESKEIGILIFSEEIRYEESKSGIMDQLKKDGFGKPAVRYRIENARGSKAKAVQLLHSFAAAKMDLIITIGTSATIPAVREIKDVPIVFSTVYDPVEAGIAKGWQSSGNNTTGSSTWFPMSKILESLREISPGKRLVVLYTPGEKNSEAQVREIQKYQSGYSFQVIPIILSNKEEAAVTVSNVVHTAHAIYLTGSSVIGASMPTIVGIANQASVITLTHLDDLVEKGALIGVCPNSYLVGRLAGKKAGEVLKGAHPSSIPIEPEKKLNYILNLKTAEAGRFHIPPSFMGKVTKTIK